MDYNARVELDRRFPTDDDEADDLVDQLMDELAPYHVTVSRTPHGRMEVILTVPAESLRQASSTVLAVVTAAGFEPFALEVLPTDEFDRRSEQEMVTAMLSVTGAAELLEVNRSRVQQLIDGGQLAAVKVGATWAVLRSSAEARAAAQGRAAEARAAAGERIDEVRAGSAERLARVRAGSAARLAAAQAASKKRIRKGEDRPEVTSYP